MKCLIDTNILYLLTHFNTNEYNLEKIEKFCKDNECFIDLYSIFELFNNSSVPIKQLKSFVNFLKIKNIKICCNGTMRAIFKDSLNLANITPKSRLEIRNKLSKGIIPEYSFLFSVLIDVNFLSLFMFNQNSNNAYYNAMANFISKSFPIIENLIRQTMEDLCLKNKFNEKTLKQLYVELTSGFFFSVFCANEKFQKVCQRQNDYEKYFNMILEEIKQNGLSCGIVFNMKGSHKQENPVLINMFLSEFRKRFSTKRDADCFFGDVVNFIYQRQDNKIEKAWLKYTIKNIFYDEATVKSNNFIDFMIIRDFAIEDNFDVLITCDDAMQKIMKLLNFNEKIEKSLDCIEEFKH